MSTAGVGRDAKFGTYRRAGLPAVDTDAFHRDELPRRLASGGNERVAWDVAGKPPIAIVDHESWLDYLYEYRTRYGLLYSNAVAFLRGSFDTWDDWEPAIRCMYSGRPIYDPSRCDFRSGLQPDHAGIRPGRHPEHRRGSGTPSLSRAEGASGATRGRRNP